MIDLPVERYEYKYFLPASAISLARALIAPYVEPDPHSEGSYTVSNLYLDTQDLEFFRAHEQGAPDRYKLRVRAYDVDRAETCFLEIKRKVKRVTLKRRAEISRGACRRLFEGSCLEDLREPVLAPLQEFIGRFRLSDARPLVLLEYRREAYISRFGDETRVTFDRDIRYQPAVGGDLQGPAGAWRHLDDVWAMGGTPAILLELKWNGSSPPWMTEVVGALGLVRRSFSKYVAAVAHWIECGADDPCWGRVSTLGAIHE